MLFFFFKGTEEKYPGCSGTSPFRRGGGEVKERQRDKEICYFLH